MSENSDMKRYMRELTNIAGEEIYSIRARVVEVDEEAMTCNCVPLLSGGDLLDVQLIPRDNNGVVGSKGIAGGGVIFIPAVGSVVFVTMLTQSDGFVSMTSEVSHVWLGGDNYGGLIKIEELITKINNIEDKYNDVIAILKAVAIPLAPSGTYLFSTIPAVANATPLTNTTKTELENPMILHGDGQAFV